MTTRTSETRASRWLLGVIAMLVLLAGGATPRVWASGYAETKVPQLLTVQGVVCSKSGAPIRGAVVYLQDAKSLTVKSYLSDAQGRFHFRQLSPSLDYDLWAEMNGKRSKTKSISQFNSKPQLSFKLKVPVEK